MERRWAGMGKAWTRNKQADKESQPKEKKRRVEAKVNGSIEKATVDG
jgi:hypothetical protein